MDGKCDFGMVEVLVELIFYSNFGWTLVVASSMLRIQSTHFNFRFWNHVQSWFCCGFPCRDFMQIMCNDL